MPVEHRQEPASACARWMRGICTVFCTIGLVLAGRAFAADLQVLSVQEPNPGTVVATVRTTDAQPPATAFRLLFPNHEASPQAFTASEITPVTNTGADLATPVTICVDRSGSMYKALTAIKSALQDAFAVPRPDLQVTILSFGSSISEPQPLASDGTNLAHVIGNVQGEHGKDGKTLLYFAIVEAINRLKDNQQANASAGRLLVISDGKDEGSPISLDSLIKDAKQRGFRIDSIGFGSEAPRSSTSLESLSNATNGKFVLATTNAELSEAIRNALGTTPAPAFEVRFEYPAPAAGIQPVPAMMQYAESGADAVTVPLNKPLAPPAVAPPPPPPAPGPATVSNTVAADTTSTASAQKNTPAVSVSAQFKIWFNSPSPILKLSMGRLAAAILVLAAVLVWIVLYLKRQPARPEVEPVTPVPTDSGAVRMARAETQISAAFAAPSRGKPAAVLVGRSGVWRGKQYPIEQSMIHIGSDTKNELALTGDEHVSRRHATIRYESGTLYLADLSSTNGTFLNGTRVSDIPGALAPGDEIRFGRTSFELQRVDDRASPDYRREDRHRVP